MATDRLNIILDAHWRGRGDVAAANRDIGGIQKATNNAKMALKDIAVVGGLAFAGLATASKLAWDAINRGADIELVQRKFDNLTTSIGSTSDALLNDMKRASDGMVSNSQLMSGAVELMQGKLAKTHDQVVRLSTVSTQLGWDMGVLAQTINNQSVLRLDNLGVAAEDVIPRFNALKEAGMGVKEAFTEALVEAGEAQLKLVGSEADTTRGKLNQITTVLDNVKDSFFATFAETAVNSIEETSGSVQNLESDLVAVSEYVGTSLSYSFINFFTVAKYGFSQIASAINAIQGFASGILPDWGAPPTSTSFVDPNLSAISGINFPGGQPGASVMADAATRSYKNELEALGKEYKVVNDLGEKSLVLRRREARAIEEAAAAAEDSIGSFGGYAGAVRNAAAEMAALEAATGDYFAQARRMQDFNPFESLFESLDRYGGNALQLANVGVAGGLFDQSQAQEYLRRTALMYQADNLAKAIASGKISEQAAVDQLSGLKQGFETGEILAQDFFAGINDETLEPSLMLETDPAWQAYLTVRGQIEANPPTVVLNVVNPATEAERERYNRPPPNIPEQ